MTREEKVKRNERILAGKPKLSRYPQHLWISASGQFWAGTLKELKEKVGPGHVSKMYKDKKDGRCVHCGYVIGKNWLTRYAPVEIEVER